MSTKEKIFYLFLIFFVALYSLEAILMSNNKENFKDTGKGFGRAFKNFGKAMGTTMKVAFTDESNSNGEGKKTKTGEAWTEVGHGFRDLGKQIGKTAKELVDSVDEKENKKDINKEEALDVEFEEKK